MLRAINRQKIAEVLEASYFGIDNYEVNFNAHDRCLVSITFLPNPLFEFEMNRLEGAKPIVCHESPGLNFLTRESYGVSSIEFGLHRLEGWMQRIREETVATNPFAKEISELKAHMDERLADLGEDINSFFSREEAETLNQNLAEFSERLDQIAARNGELEDVVKALKKTVADLQEASTTITQGTWYRMAGGRLLSGLKVFGKSKEVRELALESAKKFLLGSN